MSNPPFELGMLAIVEQENGNKYVAVYTLAPGIDYFWCEVIDGTMEGSQFTNPDRHVQVIGKLI